MPALETVDLHQKAVLWAKNGTNRYGEVKVDAATEIDVRWETTERQVIGPNGSPISLDSVAYVDQDITVGSIMWLGELTDVPTPPTNLREVVDFKSVPDIRNKKTRRRVFLTKYSSTLPGLA